MSDNAFLKTLKGQAVEPPPCWFMRQAGRYLPEYLQTRKQAGSFLDLCYSPDLAAEVTLQPIRRFDMDAAILFADILLVPQALGMKVWFEQGEGPRLASPLQNSDIDCLFKKADMSVVAPVFETVKTVRAALAQDKALIGFAGAPWTVATYMLAGKGSKDPSALRSLYYQDPAKLNEIIDRLTDATIDYLIAQIESGADAIQLFESWAQGLPEKLMLKLCLEPTRKIAAALKQNYPQIPIIVFPRGAGPVLEAYAEIAQFDAIGIDTAVPWQWARKVLSPKKVVQGGLDPLLVVTGGAEMEKAVKEMRETFAGTAYIFNLGHGFVPETPPQNVARLMQLIRQ